MSLRAHWWAGLAALVLTAPLGATVILPATLDELAAEADAVVYARVAHVSPRQLAGSLRVERLVTLDVFRYLKAGGQPTLQLRVPGGTLGRYRTVTPGAPEFAVGEEAIFFVRADVSGPWLVGLGQGVHRIVVDETTGRRLMRSPMPTGPDGALRRGDPARPVVSLDEFEGRLAATLIAHRARRSARR